MGIRIPTVDSAPTVEFEDAVHAVMEALVQVPDFRDPRGTLIELKGTLGLAVLAGVAGSVSYRAIEQYGKLREETLIPLLGLTRAPSDSTIRRIAQGVDAEAIRKVLWESARVALADRRRLVTAKDGKTMRACRTEAKRDASMVSLVEHNSGVVMDAGCAKEGEGELTAARRLDGTVAAGKAEIMAETADALYANSPDAERAVQAGEVYVVKVKETRPTSSKRSSSASSRAPLSPTSAARSRRATVA